LSWNRQGQEREDKFRGQKALEHDADLAEMALVFGRDSVLRMIKGSWWCDSDQTYGP